MQHDSPAELERLIQAAAPETLRQMLLELAVYLEPVRLRIARLALVDDPVAMAARFDGLLERWRGSNRYVKHDEVYAYTLELEAWLDAVACELLPVAPERALALFERFIQCDGHWFESADDSGELTLTMEMAFECWTKAARACAEPVGGWRAHVERLIGDDYGSRDGLLRVAALLFGEVAVR